MNALNWSLGGDAQDEASLVRLAPDRDVGADLLQQRLRHVLVLLVLDLLPVTHSSLFRAFRV